MYVSEPVTNISNLSISVYFTCSQVPEVVSCICHRSLLCTMSYGFSCIESQSALDNDQAMIREVTSLILKIKDHPIERIAPFAEHIHFLSGHLETLLQRLDDSMDSVQLPRTSEDALICCPVSTMLNPSTTTTSSPSAPISESRQSLAPHHNKQQLCSNAAPGVNVKTIHYKQSVTEALHCAVKNIVTVEKAVVTIGAISKPDRPWFEQDKRIAHLQAIAILQKRKRTPLVLPQDRLLLILSCQSLAQDFQYFEKKSGWVPKEDQLIERILSGQDPSSQSIGKHFQNFLASHTALPTDREQLDAGLRLGTKLRVIDAVTKSLGLGSGLALLLGYEYHKVSRLSYGAFPILKHALEFNEVQRKAIYHFSETIGPWLQDNQARYHEVYGRLLKLSYSSSFSCLRLHRRTE